MVQAFKVQPGCSWNKCDLFFSISIFNSPVQTCTKCKSTHRCCHRVPFLVVFTFPPCSPRRLPPSFSPVSVFLCPSKGSESGRRRSLQRAGDFPHPGDESGPGLHPHPAGPPGLLGLGCVPVDLPPPEVGRAQQQRGGDHLLRHHPGGANHHGGIGNMSPRHRPTAGQWIQVLRLMFRLGSCTFKVKAQTTPKQTKPK